MLYLDSSAIVKLVVPEPETGALVQTLRSDPEMVSSVLAWVEVLRAVLRSGVMRTASTLKPHEIRTLDAIHLATALSLAPALAGLITYDARLASAARAAGLTVQVPR